ncbi:unnamed protein product [Vicia faba]|uniref:F-box domain-containing protein n=1 Tax=Vicia faba TaxID=3906 RepID=A0AAV0YJZ5_VICFA|nr:unnamed protein product [Vicia faba]
MLAHETKDRFGDLPDSVVFHILSYLKTKEAFKTCILSKRWNNLTNNLPIITLDSGKFKSLDRFERALFQILSVRNELDDDSTSVLHTLDLTLTTTFDFCDDFPPSTDVVFKRVVRGGMYLDDYNQPLKLRISPPSLCNLAFTGNTSQKLCLTHPCSLQHLYIDAENAGFVDSLVQEDSAVLLSSLQGLPNIRSLTVSSNTLQVLSLVPSLFKVKLTSFCNLESLQVQMKPLSGQLYNILSYGKFMIRGVNLHEATIIPDGVVDCLIQNSPSANVTVIPYNKRGVKL